MTSRCTSTSGSSRGAGSVRPTRKAIRLQTTSSGTAAGLQQRLLRVHRQRALGGRHGDRCFGRRSRQLLAPQRCDSWFRNHYVRAYDGTAWGNWDSFTFASTNTAPVATISNHTLSAAQWAQLINWTSATDADGDAITNYQFWDGGGAANSALFLDTHQFALGGRHGHRCRGADLASLWVQGGTAGVSDTMYLRAFDGTE